MHKHVRVSYADASDREIDKWRLTALNDAVHMAETQPQKAVDNAASSFASAVIAAAESSLQNAAR